ncbi:MAG: hypothetical protein ABIB79_01495 [archaeon]
MKIELYSVPGDKNGELLKKFLERNKLQYKEIITEDINVLRKVVQGFPCSKISLLRIRYSSSIHVIMGFDPWPLKQFLEHIEKYKPKSDKTYNKGLQ